MSTSLADIPISTSDSDGVRWAKLDAYVVQSLGELGIGYSATGYLAPIQTYDSDGVRFAKLGAKLQLLAVNVAGGGGGTAATGVDATLNTVADLQAIPMVGATLPCLKVWSNQTTFTQEMWRAILSNDATDLDSGVARSSDWAQSGVVWFRRG